MSRQTSDRTSQQAIALAQELSKSVAALDFQEAIPWVYNPLEYAWLAHEQYLSKFAQSSCRVLLLGMNPGPWGMAQCGVPFGEISAVRDYLGIDAKIGRPSPEHPKRPIEGFDCKRSEVSGRRLWGLMQNRYPDAAEFFEQHFVANYCPLVFMEESARNVTPDKLPAEIRNQLEALCDAHLAKLLRVLCPEWLIGVGAFAEACGKRVVQHHDISDVSIGRILHPSPASPAANRDWAGTVTKQMNELGVW